MKKLAQEGYSFRKLSSLFAKENTVLFTSWLKDYFKHDSVEPDYDFFLKNGHQIFGMQLAKDAGVFELMYEID